MPSTVCPARGVEETSMLAPPLIREAGVLSHQVLSGLRGLGSLSGFETQQPLKPTPTSTRQVLSCQEGKSIRKRSSAAGYQLEISNTTC